MIFRRQNGVWSASRPPATSEEELRAITGWLDSGALVAYAAGTREGGALLRLDSDWQTVPALASNSVLSAAWSAGAGHLMVGGGYAGMLGPYMMVGTTP